MFLLFKTSLFLVVHISIVFAWPVDEQQSKTDDMCGTLRNVLSVKDVLMDMATAAKSIDRKANEIQKYIENKTQIVDTLNRYVNWEIDYIDSQLPTSAYHVQFLKLNNIDKDYLVNLFLETHYAMSFYYNSIEDILNMNDIFALKTDSWLKEIKASLRNGMICPYRSILNVYSYRWPSINHIKRIQFSEENDGKPQSLVHDAHSIVVTRLLRQWMGSIDFILTNLERKFV